MRGEGAEGTRGGVKRWQIYSLGPLYRKLSRKLEGGDRSRGTHSRIRGETSGEDAQGVRDAGTETDDTQLGGGPRPVKNLGTI